MIPDLRIFEQGLKQKVPHTSKVRVKIDEKMSKN